MVGRDSLLTVLATTALHAGLGVAAVTRADGGRVAWQALADAARAAGIAAPLPEHAVGVFGAVRGPGTTRRGAGAGRPDTRRTRAGAGRPGQAAAAPGRATGCRGPASAALGRSAAPGQRHERLDPGRQVPQRPGN
jgi:hypothetical protein